MQHRDSADWGENGSFRPFLVTKKQAASLLAVSVRTIENLLAQHELPFRKLGKRTLIPYTAVAQLARHDVRVISGQRLAS
ncbi:MAG: excisionase family DNA-binding protein [Terriglobales bacterium]